MSNDRYEGRDSEDILAIGLNLTRIAFNPDVDYSRQKKPRMGKINRTPKSQSGHESFDPRNTLHNILTIGSIKVEGQCKPKMF
jgi:hypothetical protein